MKSPSQLYSDIQYQPISQEERQKRFIETRAARPKGEPMWVFGFGSLMWRPDFDHDVRTPAVLQGYDRHFRIWSTRGRGSPDKPGLGLCLEDCQGSCRGIAFRACEDTIEETWEKLWDREMGSGVYKAQWLGVDTDTHGRVAALTFVVDRDHPHYTGPMPIDHMATFMANACGEYGECRDYLANTIKEMQALGVEDSDLIALLHLVDEHRAR